MKRLEPEIEREIRRLAAKGHKLREIGRMLGCSRHAVTNTLRREPRPPSPSSWNPSAARLSLEEREEIRVGLERGDSFTAIAQAIRRAVSTVSREVKANGGRDVYRAHGAHRAAYQQARRPKSPKLACPRLAAKVAEWLELWWSPEQIAQRLRMEFPDDPMMRVSHETIYMSLFVEGPWPATT
jgi:IS30 family transposase